MVVSDRNPRAGRGETIRVILDPSRERRAGEVGGVFDGRRRPLGDAKVGNPDARLPPGRYAPLKNLPSSRGAGSISTVLDAACRNERRVDA